VRKLVAVASAAVLYNTILLTVLTPLLPQLAESLDLSKRESGVLVASYAVGVLGGALVGGVAVVRLGARATLVGGLALMASMSLLFGLADDAVVLGAARFGQGAASAIGWTGALALVMAVAPRHRRGELIGVTMSATVVGALLGPVVGGATGLIGRDAAFAGLAAVGVVVAAATRSVRVPFERGAPQPLRALARALRDEPHLRIGLWLGTMTALIFGLVSVLAPLRLGDLGWGSVGVGATYLVAATLQAIGSPLLGRWSDRVGRLLPARAALVSSTLILVALSVAPSRWLVAALVVGSALSNTVLWVTGVAALTDGSDAGALEHGLAFTLMNLTWAPGHIAGAGLGGALAGVAGDTAPYLCAAGLCVVTYAVLRRRRDGPPALAVPDAREAA
jgi:MFS family permease